MSQIPGMPALHGQSFLEDSLEPAALKTLLQEAFAAADVDAKRLLVIIPDGTRTAPIALMFRLLYELLGARVARLDYLIALGTHRPMSPEAISRLVGASEQERAQHYPKSHIYNHAWHDPEALRTVGVLSSEEMAQLTQGLVTRETAITLNCMIDAYDALLICGPVFPHEVAGFSGGAKYLFPGIAGQDIIDSTHWLGALSTSYDTIGVKDTAVRRVLHAGSRFVTEQMPVTALSLVMQGQTLRGAYIGELQASWAAAADVSAKLNIRYHPHSYQSVLSMPPPMYEDLWTAAKAMYKTEPVIADGGEVIIYAPHLKDVSLVHGEEIKRVGYHVRDYFLAQWSRFKDIHWTTLAHSTHVKGKGSYVDGVETPRIQVTLATAIPAELCAHINLGYRDYRSIDPEAWRHQEHAGKLLVEHAGEVLHRVAS